MIAEPIPTLMKPKHLAPALALLLFTSAVPVFAGEPSAPATGPARGKEVLVVKDSKDAQTFNAEGQDVTVNGSHNKVTIKGTCHALTVSGDTNGVTVESVATISISGNGNEIAWTKTVDGTKPQITDLGKDNKVTHPDTKAP